MAQIRSGPGRVIDAGVVTTFAGHDLEIVVAPAGDLVAVELRFVSDGSGVPGVASEATDRGWRLTCTNFDDDVARGSADPVLLGEIDDDLYFLHFRASRHGRSSDRTVHFTLYQVAKADVGWRPG